MWILKTCKFDKMNIILIILKNIIITIKKLIFVNLKTLGSLFIIICDCYLTFTKY